MSSIDNRGNIRKKEWPKGPKNVDSFEEDVHFFFKYVTDNRGHLVRELVSNRGTKICAIINNPEPTPFGFDFITHYYVVFKKQWENCFGFIYDMLKSEVGMVVTIIRFVS